MVFFFFLQIHHRNGRITLSRHFPQARQVCVSLSVRTSTYDVACYMWAVSGAGTARKRPLCQPSLCQTPQNLCGRARPIWKLNTCARKKTTKIQHYLKQRKPDTALIYIIGWVEADIHHKLLVKCMRAASQRAIKRNGHFLSVQCWELHLQWGESLVRFLVGS